MEDIKKISFEKLTTYHFVEKMELDIFNEFLDAFLKENYLFKDLFSIFMEKNQSITRKNAVLTLFNVSASGINSGVHGFISNTEIHDIFLSWEDLFYTLFFDTCLFEGADSNLEDAITDRYMSKKDFYKDILFVNAVKTKRFIVFSCVEYMAHSIFDFFFTLQDASLISKRGS